MSENFLGWGRLLPWFYSCIPLLEDDEPMLVPDKPVGQWIVEECKTFLRERRLPLTGKKAELIQRVRENKGLPVPPPIGCSSDLVERLLLSLFDMICCLMGIDTVTDVNAKESEQLIMRFLTMLAQYDDETQEAFGRKKPIWVTRYNYPCLLNIPEQMRMLGPIRNRWEGGVRGEGILRHIKPIIQSNRKNWQKNLLEKILQQKTLQQLQEVDEQIWTGSMTACDSDKEDECIVKHPSQSFKVYTLPQLLSDLDSGKPLSCVHANSQGEEVGKVYAVYTPEKSTHHYAMCLTPSDGKLHFGMFYYKIHIAPSKGIILREIDVAGYCVLLPLATKWPPAMQDADGCHCFAMVTSGWKIGKGKNDMIVSQPEMIASVF